MVNLERLNMGIGTGKSGHFRDGGQHQEIVITKKTVNRNFGPGKVVTLKRVVKLERWSTEEVLLYLVQKGLT